MKLSKYNIRCDKSIENWDEALVQYFVVLDYCF